MRELQLAVSAAILCFMSATPIVAQTIMDETQAFVQERNEFAFVLRDRSLPNEQSENFVFSPHSLSSMMALVYGGADGITKSEIQSAFRFGENPARVVELLRKLGTQRKQPLGLRAKQNRGYGLLVTEVVTGSMAEGAGIEEDDLLINIDDVAMQTETAYANVMERSVNAIKVTWYDHSKGIVAMAEVPLLSSHGVRSANGVWVDLSVSVSAAFSNFVMDEANAEMKSLDFSKRDGALEEINGWSNRATDGMIPVLFEELDAETSCVLANAITMLAPWEMPFMEADTKEGRFHLADSEAISIPMMRGTVIGGWWSNDGYDVASLPFSEDSSLDLILVMPSKNADIAASREPISWAVLQRAIQEIQLYELTASIPRWKIETRLSLRDVMKGLGVESLFTDACNLSNITGEQEFMIDQIVQNVVIEVDEKGAKAAAISGAAAVPRFSGIEKLEVNIDRPFEFFVVDRASQLIWFAGRVSDPRM